MQDNRSTPPINHVLETVLYVDEMHRAAKFYQDILGLAVMHEGEQMTAFNTGRHTVLLLFTRGASLENTVTPGGTIPGHNGTGPAHMAFAIATEAYEAWRQHLQAHDIPILSEVRWKRGGHSLYFNDSDGHVLELATPGLWPNY